MGKRRKELSHEEIWDDSGLLDSWNQSYEEYKRYHSIHARGERISDVLKAAQDSNKQDIGEDNTPAEKLKGQGLDSEGGGINLTWTKDIPKNDVSDNGQTTTSLAAPLPGANSTAAQTFPNPTITHSSQDQSLKDVMMSWYWAGYYTGLYEGQRQAVTEKGLGSSTDPNGGNGG
ncbi:hypothetical protein MMC10_001131 [Thelotrema lepadinum]|nr:hypothetical protein [Thelotrema lepadinum]